MPTEILMCLLSDIQLYCEYVVVYADIDGHTDRASETPLATTTIYSNHTSYYPDIVVYNEQYCKIQLVELTCPFKTTNHLQGACECKCNINHPKTAYSCKKKCASK